jgi:hypothetical protein
MFVPSSACDPSLTIMPYFVHILVSSSSDDDSEDENPPLPAHIPLDESIEHEPAPTPSLLKWVPSTREAIGDLTGDPSNQCQTC